MKLLGGSPFPQVTPKPRTSVQAIVIQPENKNGRSIKDEFTLFCCNNRIPSNSPFVSVQFDSF